MLMVRPSLEFIALVFALFKIGAVIILIDPGMGYRNLLGCIEKVRPEVFIGIARAHLFKFIFNRFFRTVRTSVWIGSSPWLFRSALSAGKAAESASPKKLFPTAAMQADDLATAIDKLQNAMERTDGCVLRGAPDGNGPARDWITDCDAQEFVYPLLHEALETLTP